MKIYVSRWKPPSLPVTKTFLLEIPSLPVKALPTGITILSRPGNMSFPSLAVQELSPYWKLPSLTAMTIYVSRWELQSLPVHKTFRAGNYHPFPSRIYVFSVLPRPGSIALLEITIPCRQEN